LNDRQRLSDRLQAFVKSSSGGLGFVRGDLREAKAVAGRSIEGMREERDLLCIEDEGWSRLQPIAASLVALRAEAEGRHAGVLEAAEAATASGRLWFGAAFADGAPLVAPDTVEHVMLAQAKGRAPALRPIFGASTGCYPVGTGSNIARDMLLRGLYAPHLRGMLAHVPSEQVLVLLDSELKSDSNSTMRRVTDFLGLPSFDYSAVTENEIGEHFNRLYPRFEDASGWSLQGGYDAIPSDVATELAAFYAPFNRALERMLGRPTGWRKN